MATDSDDPGYAVRHSKIHGRGLFATRTLKPEHLLGTFGGTRTQRDGVHVLWIESDDGSCYYGIRGNTDLRFANHSARPNAEFDGAELWTLRRIRKGEEITLHYGEAWDDVD